MNRFVFMINFRYSWYVKLEDKLVNKNNLFNLAIALLLVMLSAQVNANDMTNLYNGKIAVTDQSNLSRNNAIEILFERTLIKVSGQGKISQHPNIEPQMSNALSFATSFSFNNKDGQTYLNVEFNETLVDELLRSNGVTLWGVRRPSAMLWLVYEDENGHRKLLNSQTNDELSLAAKKAADNRGLPLLLPIWDLDEQLILSIADVWGQFENKVAMANTRYLSDYMILAKVTNHGISQKVHWNVYKISSGDFGQVVSENKMVGNDEAINIDDALHQIVGQSTDYFATQYGVDTSQDQGELFITLVNIHSLGTYVDVVNYLKSIKAVDSLMLVNNKKHKYQFRVKLIGDKQSLVDVISLGNKMMEIENDDPNQILYQWGG